MMPTLVGEIYTPIRSQCLIRVCKRILSIDI